MLCPLGFPSPLFKKSEMRLHFIFVVLLVAIGDVEYFFVSRDKARMKLIVRAGTGRANAQSRDVCLMKIREGS